jgi:3-methyl-2-oxobutanoate hydroxymethyltransferase
MSSARHTIQVPADASRLPMTLPRLAEMKRLGEPIVMVTAYDYPSARAAEAAGVDLVLVGDSGAMTVLGYPSTVAVETDEMLVLAKAARRGLSTPFLIVDLPFGSYEISDEQAVATAMRFVKEAGCDAVKLEGGNPMSIARARAIF